MTDRKWSYEEEEEYHELCSFHRHYDIVAYTSGAIFIVASFGLLTKAFEEIENKIPLAFISIMLFWFWKHFFLRRWSSFADNKKNTT